MFSKLQNLGFDIEFTYHAEAILREDFPDAADEISAVLTATSLPVEELVRGGGGESKVTQRMRRSLHAYGWQKGSFRVEKKINERTTFSQSHEVDHVKSWPSGDIALEIEWNNKDPFFDRDLENFSRLHADGAISVGIIVTRGASLQNGLESAIAQFVIDNAIQSYDDLKKFGVIPTVRQRRDVDLAKTRHNRTFGEVWAESFVRDKFGSSTTHWDKLTARLQRGVGSPCPLVAIGIPLSCVSNSL